MHDILRVVFRIAPEQIPVNAFIHIRAVESIAVAVRFKNYVAPAV